jgi:polyisoprenoid-binding protein YceI
MKKVIGLVALAVLVVVVVWGMNNSKKGQEKTVVADTTVQEISDEVLDSAQLVDSEAGQKEAVVEGAYTVSLEDSTVQWTGSKKLIKEWVDTGTIALKEGTFTVSGAQMVSGSIVFDMTSIETQNTGAGEEASPKLSTHLKSADFFEVETYPSATFDITEVVPGETEYSYIANGNLTIKDVTNDISVPVIAYMQDGMMKVSGEALVDRTLWNVKYGSEKFFDNLANNVINDEFSLKFDLVAQAQ